MKGGMQAALVLGAGDVLGRRHKRRLTTMLAAATGGLGGLAVERGNEEEPYSGESEESEGYQPGDSEREAAPVRRRINVRRRRGQQEAAPVRRTTTQRRSPAARAGR